MASVIEDRIQIARKLLEVARSEYQKAQQEKGGTAVIALRHSCGKGWLAALDAANAFFIKQGAAEDSLPHSDRGRRYFARLYMEPALSRTFVYLRQTFHVDGYYEGIVEFEDMPDYFDELEEFIDLVEAEPPREVLPE